MTNPLKTFRALRAPARILQFSRWGRKYSCDEGAPYTRAGSAIHRVGIVLRFCDPRSHFCGSVLLHGHAFASLPPHGAVTLRSGKSGGSAVITGLVAKVFAVATLGLASMMLVGGPFT